MMSSSSTSHASSSSLPSNITNSVNVRLDRNNYPLWLVQIVPLLRSRNLQKYVDGTSICPGPFLKDENGEVTNIINPAYEEWIQNDQLVLSWINGSLSQSLLSTVARYTSARAVWSSLEQRFSSQNQQRIVELHTELVTTKRGDLSISDFLDKIHSIADNLSLSSSLISDEDLVSIIMSNVGPLYENIVASVQARETPISYAGLEALLLSAERCLTSIKQYPYPSDSTVVMKATRGGPNNRGGRGFPRKIVVVVVLIIFLGVSMVVMVLLDGLIILVLVLKIEGYCQLQDVGIFLLRQISILKMGHSAIDCYNRMNHAYEGHIPPQRLSAMISTSTSFGSPNWLTDTGANAHITPDNGNLMHPRDYNGQDTIGGVVGGSVSPSFLIILLYRIWQRRRHFSVDRAVMVFIYFLVEFFNLVIHLLMLMFVVMLKFGIHCLDILRP
ncbi:hypothetical protein WN944_001941 [Citrus x changshan-huyou]|uniref:Retrotransposon Copia-like N-terminal domain-containing protein n=1 Tax=Citrus x changshan-huyou TaxID=2935761 RepID=A0AAP0QN35_9ROSI